MSAPVAPFDGRGPLPEGVTMLEASAGTGKTFTIAALTTRYVAAGIPLERMLLVTFTRLATGELRERVRRRLHQTRRGLAACLDGRSPDPGDAVLALLAEGTRAEITLRLRRLTDALASFDAATITTTHGFCHQMLAGLGVVGDIAPGSAVVEDVDDLVAEIVDDRYLARALQTAAPPFSREVATRVARAAVADPRTPIAPVAGDQESPGRLRRRLALSVRSDVARRQRQAGLLTYDDLLTRLTDVLEDRRSGPAARARLRDRYDVVLVDEFQDTDEMQWRILQAAFTGDPAARAGTAGATTLVLIGDPKQAIYGFRGADVHAYLEAASTAGRTATLSVNWRSDQGLLDAYDALWSGASLGPADIVYRRVEAAPDHQLPGMETPDGGGPLRLRVVHRDDGAVTLTRTGMAQRGSAREVIGRDLAACVVGLLTDGSVLVDRGGDGAGTGRAVRPGDIAVLTRRHRHAAIWSGALADAGVPAVINGVGSVFATPAADQWRVLLEALERPASAVRVHNMALTPFAGWSAEDVDAAGDHDWEALHAACHRWAAVLRRSGVATLLEMVSRTQGLPARVLAQPGGERHLTDIRHVGQLLHTEATAERMGTTALVAWLRRRIRDAADDTGTEERTRRLESDADAVQILTIHRSKGLEFPIVLYPDLCEPQWIPDDGQAVVYHDDAGVRTLDVTGRGPDFDEHRRRQRVELRGEDLRLAYVALTRARHHAVVWWVGAKDAGDSPLGRLLFGRGPDGTVAATGVGIPDDDDALARFGRLAASAPGRIGVERVVAGPVLHWSSPPPGRGALRAATFSRTIDDRWRRTSYSGLTAAAHDPVVSTEPEQVALTDEEDTVEPVGPLDADGPGTAALRAVPLPLAAVPGGTRVGTLVHRVLEVVDFTVADLPGALAAALDDAQARGRVPLGDPRVVVAGLDAAVRTPLGPLADGRALRDIARGDRLDELAFELPVAGGDDPSGEVDLAAVADLVDRHLPPGDPLHGYGARLRDPALAGTFRGYLTGSLDLVARLAAPGRPDRFVVMDYKTNVLGDDRAALSAWDYRPAALAEAMQRAHYPLQALLYLVALHRYLRWRVAGYDPERQLGGALYLFVRGMTGPDGPTTGPDPCGVFAWRPPTALVVDLAGLLGTGRAR